MPVITRSQSRLLTSSTNESSKASNLLTNSSIESSEVTSTSNNLSLESNNIFQHILPSFQHDLLNRVLPDEVSLENNNWLSMEIEFQNFEFQTVTTVEASSSISKIPLQLVHKFDSSSSVNMEADCKESTMDKKLPSEPVDLSQLILSLSRQISNQTQSIQDQLSQQNSVLQDQSVQNELRFQTVIQENEEFKRSVRSELDQLKTMLASSVPAVLVSCGQGN